MLDVAIASEVEVVATEAWDVDKDAAVQLVVETESESAEKTIFDGRDRSLEGGYSDGFYFRNVICPCIVRYHFLESD